LIGAAGYDKEYTRACINKKYAAEKEKPWNSYQRCHGE
jgi:hypothetical protein